MTKRNIAACISLKWQKTKYKINLLKLFLYTKYTCSVKSLISISIHQIIENDSDFYFSLIEITNLV